MKDKLSLKGKSNLFNPQLPADKSLSQDQIDSDAAEEDMQANVVNVGKAKKISQDVNDEEEPGTSLN